MPSNIIKSFSDKTGKTESEVEKLWNQAKASAEESGHKEDYPYIVGILKTMLDINEEYFKSLSKETKIKGFKDFYYI